MQMAINELEILQVYNLILKISSDADTALIIGKSAVIRPEQWFYSENHSHRLIR